MDQKINIDRTHLFSPNINVTVLVTISGEIKPEELTRAIWEAVKSNGILSCRIELKENGDAFYSVLDEPVFNIQILNESVPVIIKAQERIPFELEKGEMVRFFILPGSQEVKLLIMAHHLAGDGLSLAILTEDIMAALSGSGTVHKPLRLLLREDLPKKSSLNALMHLMAKELNSKWSKSGRVFTFEDYRRMFSKYWENRETVTYSQALASDFLELMKKKSRDYKVTLNSTITTALLRAEGKKSDVGIAVNIRKDGNRTMGNYASGISIICCYKEKLDFWTNAQRVHKLIYKKLNSNRKKFFLLQFLGQLDGSLTDSAYFSAYEDYGNKTAVMIKNMFGYGNRPKNLSITNLTRLDINLNYGRFTLTDFIFIPPVAPNAKHMFGMVSLGGKLNLVMHVFKDNKEQEDKEYFQKVIAYLNKAVAD